MAFAGLKKEKDRASVILYLNQNSDEPTSITLIFQDNKVESIFVHELYLEACSQTFDCLLLKTFSSTSLPLGRQCKNIALGHFFRRFLLILKFLKSLNFFFY